MRRPQARASPLHPPADELKAHHAFELSLRFLAGLRIEPALSWFAQVVRGEERRRLRVDELAATLLDENAGDCSLAWRGRQILAIPTVSAKSGGQEIAQQISLIAGFARIADDADPADHAFVTDQHRSYNGKSIGLGAGILLHLRQQVVGSRPILELIVVPEIDFTQSAYLHPAQAEIPPSIERAPGRTAIGTAGIVDELVRQLPDCRSKLHVPDLEPAGAILRRTQDGGGREQGRQQGSAHNVGHTGV